MKVCFIGAEELLQGIEYVSGQLDMAVCAADEAELTVKVTREDRSVSRVILRGRSAEIVYGGGRARFFRALARLAGAYREGKTGLDETETPLFDKNGAMIDMSRNAVMKKERVKYLLRTMALMGLSTMMLYTEDTYEIKAYPYFGYMRGRYTEEELKELDAYALALGIELIPCIQLLGHLATALRWPEMAPVRDTARVLLEGSTDTARLIGEAMNTVRRCFTTRRIHMGMDETHDLGLGAHLNIHGYEERENIYFRHLELVAKMAKEHGLEPMIWSDMFFRMQGERQKIVGLGDYDLRVELPQSITERLPENLTPVFWDYYHADEAFYEQNLLKHRLFRKPAIFAGGIWMWSGFAPQFTRSRCNSLPALDACKKTGTREVVATVWHNGSESSLILSAAHLAMYADYDYRGGYDRAGVARTLRDAARESLDEIEKAECIEYPEPGNDCHGSSRTLMYNDPLLGLFDAQVRGIDTKSYYQTAVTVLNGCKVGEEMRRAIEVLRCAAEVLLHKADLGVRLKDAYDRNDRQALAALRAECGTLRGLIEKMRLAHRESWMYDNKPFGWEVHDLRYGALEARLETAADRIGEYLNGQTDRVEELEQERLPFMPPDGQGHTLVSDWYKFGDIYTANVL